MDTVTLQDHSEDCKKKGSKIADFNSEIPNLQSTSCNLKSHSNQDLYTIYIIFTILKVPAKK